MDDAADPEGGGGGVAALRARLERYRVTLPALREALDARTPSSPT